FRALVEYPVPGREDGEEEGVAHVELDTQGPAGDLRHGFVPGQDRLDFLYRVQVGVRLPGFVEQRQESDRPLTLVHQELKQIVLVVRDEPDVSTGEGDFDRAPTLLAQDLAEGGEFGPAGVAAGQGPALIADVGIEDRGGEAERAGPYPLAEQPLHRRNLVPGGGPLEGLFAHDVVPQGGERGQGGDVDAQAALLQRVEVLRVRLPLPVDAALHHFKRDRLDIHQV